ncbi:MAG: hypothetical protein FWC99_06065 [Coriobacteriia bacterium]|nr:hypothetical protein [Coriobacteriia bacterium]
MRIILAAIVVVDRWSNDAKYAATGDIRDISRINNRDDLFRLFGGIDFDDLEIVNVGVEGGMVYALCRGTDDFVQDHGMSMVLQHPIS